MIAQLTHKIVTVLSVFIEDHESYRLLTLGVVASADDCSFGYAFGSLEGVLDLDRGESMTRDVDNIIDPTGYSVGACLVALGAVLDVVGLLIYLGEVLLLVAVGIPVQAPELGGPGLGDDQGSAGGTLEHLLVVLVVESHLYPWERVSGAAGHHVGDAGQGCAHDGARLCLPPLVNDGTT